MTLVFLQSAAVLIQSDADLVHFSLYLVQGGLFSICFSGEVQEDGFTVAVVLSTSVRIAIRRLHCERARAERRRIQRLCEVGEEISLGLSWRWKQTLGDGSNTGLDGSARKTTARLAERLETRLARLQAAK